MHEFSRIHLAPLQQLASRILETRAIEGDPDALARELLVGFHDVCLRFGLDGVLDQLALSDDPTMAEHPELRSALSAKVGSKANFDPGGPRNALPGQLATCVLSVLGLTLVDEPDRTITLDDAVLTQITGALAAVIDVELAIPKIREDVIALARSRCEERLLGAFDKIAAQLDERGMRTVRQPKLPLDAVHEIQQLLIDARFAVIAKAGNAAIDRAKQVLAKVNPEAATRIDQPISLKLTPRDVAIRRVADSRASKVPAAVVRGLIDALAELAKIAWRAKERPVRDYSASQTFAVGELVKHPKFGLGTVLSVAIQRIDVEFPEGKYTLVHARK